MAKIQLKLRLMSKVSRAKLADKKVRAKVWDAIVDTALAIENTVKGSGAHSAPFKTGTLKASYNVAFFKNRLYAEVGADPRIAPYAPHVEFGTKKQREQPHLRPAARAQRREFKKRIAAAMKAAEK